MNKPVSDIKAAPMAFIDLAAQQRRIEGAIRNAIDGVLAHGQYILGPEVKALEDQLAAYCRAKHALGCSSGTDAIVIALMALDAKPGDAVFVPSFTFAATAEAVALVGATPVFVDCIAEKYNMDPGSLEMAIDMIVREGMYRPVGVIAVDMLGQPADFNRIGAIARKNGYWLIDDAAQSFGAMLDNRRVGTLATITTTSFFPAKPLGCYGDGGAMFTDDDRLAGLMRSILFHGRGADKYDNVRIGMNGRIDTIQAAILIEKLKIFDDELDKRNQVARRYCDLLRDICRVPELIEGATTTWAQFTIIVKHRDDVAAKLKAAGVPTAIYYPKPLHMQTAYKAYPAVPGGLPVSEAMAETVLSLPMHPYLDVETQDRIVAAVKAALR